MSQESDVKKKKKKNNFEVKSFSTEKPKDLKIFDCGDSFLNGFLSGSIKKLVEQSVLTCKILIDKENDKIAGFYTLKSHFLNRDDYDVAGKIKQIPVTKLEMIALDINYQKKGIGTSLLRQALSDALKASRHVGSVGVFIDAVENKVAFYQKIGFSALADNPISHSNGIKLIPMFLTMRDIETALNQK